MAQMSADITLNKLGERMSAADRGTITTVDWQTLGVGLPARDLSYFTATSLEPELRSTIEHELVATYHRRLCCYGVSGYDSETCWYDHRLGMLQALLISALRFAFATGADRGDDMVLTVLSCGCRAIRELETVDMIGRHAAGQQVPITG